MAVPVFHSSDLIPYETRVLDPEGMLPKVAGKMNQEVMEEEVVRGTDREEDREDGAWVVGSAGNDELESKTQENLHPHPMRRQEMMKGQQETMRDKIQEMEWRHATGVEDRETSPE